MDARSGSAVLKVSQAVSRLLSNRLYHYRLVVSVDGGTTYFDGADRTFTTLPDPPGVMTSAASAVAGGAVELLGTVEPNGAATTYHFEYGTTGSYGSTTGVMSAGGGSTPGPVSEVVWGLAPGSLYHFRLVATNAGGTSYGADRTFVTAATAVGSGGGSPPGVKPVVGRLVLKDVAEVRRGVARVVASCRGARGAACGGTLVLRMLERITKLVDGRQRSVLESVTVGRVRFDVLVGGTKTLDIRLAGAAAHPLGRGEMSCASPRA